MITLSATEGLKKSTSRSKSRRSRVPQSIVDKRPQKKYYSLLIPTEENEESPYITVVGSSLRDVLQINMYGMAVYECYLFALGLPSNFRKEQVIVHGSERDKYMPCRCCYHSGRHLFDYELTVPMKTSVEAYLQRILDDLNDHFQLDVYVEQLPVVQNGKEIKANGLDQVELIWQEQPTMIMKPRKTV